ncbi:FAD-dependent oxidoreductase, partial [Klebsiella variicola]|uniref:FAD-dependent oxidoreductase n=1 Tax=Klebsiella variicola TaxID=244366 RepID=UPI001D117AA0
MLPRGVDGMIVAGRHYSATESAQKMSREIPPCMSMGADGLRRDRSQHPAASPFARPAAVRRQGDRLHPGDD